MLKTKMKSNKKMIYGRRTIALLVLCGLVLFSGFRGGFMGNEAHAVATCSSIADCQQQINNNNNAVASLQDQATSYQDAIDHLSGQINQTEAIIYANSAAQASIQSQIVTAQAEIAQEKKALSQNIRAMYLEGDISTLEILASSQNISQYVDRQQYRNAVSNKVKTSVDKIGELQAQLQVQEKQLESLISSEEAERNQLASTQYQQEQMLNYNQSQQNNFNSQTAENKAKLDALIAAQRRANSSVSSGGYYFLHFPGAITADPANGSYPYANYPFSMSLGGCTIDGPDQWGYCTRQCVSYVAWAVEYSGRTAPVGWGNAADWVGAARSEGIQFDAYPEPGDVAVSTAGTWGHVMYVEAVSGHQMYVSEYNNFLTGQYYTEWRNF